MSTTKIYEIDYENQGEDGGEEGTFDYEPIDFDYKAIEQGKERLEREVKESQHTLAIIKPSVHAYAKQIIRRIKKEGYIVVKQIFVHLTPEQVYDVYREHYGKLWFPNFVVKMSQGPSHVLCLLKENAVEDFKNLLGPTSVILARKTAPYSLRAVYGITGDRFSNGIHGSDTVLSARREVHYFFPQIVLEPLYGIASDMQFLRINILPLLKKGLLATSKEKPADPFKWLGNWIKMNIPDEPVESLREKTKDTDNQKNFEKQPQYKTSQFDQNKYLENLKKRITQEIKRRQTKQ